jgi:uncharacterized membrane protein
VPLLNPLELASLFVFFVAIRWYAAFRGYRDRGSEGESESGPGSGPARVEAVAPAIFALFLLTMAVARTVHHFASVPFDLELLARSDVFQAALSIVWGTTALLGMIIGARKRRRSVWIGGASLMAIVVVKLFLVELDNTGTLERVISFLGVGVLLLVVGYFAPVPPRGESRV